MSVRPSSHIIAVGSIDSPLHHPKDRRSTVNLRFPTLNASLNLSIGREFMAYRCGDIDMDVLEAIKGRRSVRAFRPDDVPNAVVEQLIDAARWAPSAGNIQPWEFIIVRNPELKRKLAEAALGQRFIEEAPVVIVVCANEIRSTQGYGMRGKNLYCIQDTAAAIQNLLLTAYSMGLGTCWVGAFREEEAKKALRIPEGIRPVAIIPIGYPAESPTAPAKRSLKQIIHYETYH